MALVSSQFLIGKVERERLWYYLIKPIRKNIVSIPYR